MNIGVGFVLSLIVQLALFHQLGIELPLHTNLFIICVFTVVSLIRAYVLRRLFNLWHIHRLNQGAK